MSNFYQDTEQALSHLPKCAINNEKAGNEEITPEKTLEQLKELLLPLNNIEEGYAEQALAYLLTGKDDDVIAKLTAIMDKQYNEVISDHISKVEYGIKLYQFGNEGYELSKNLFEKLHDEHIVRLGKFLASMMRLPFFVKLDEMIPLWFIHLLRENFVSLKNNSLQRLMELLAFASVTNTKEIMTQIILQKRENPRRKESYNAFRFHGMEENADFEDFFAENIELFEFYITKLTEQGETEFFTTLLEKHPNLLQLSHKIVATLCVSEHEEVRILALEKLTEIQPEKTQSNLFNLFEKGDEKQRSYAIEALIQTGQGCQQWLKEALTLAPEQALSKQINIGLNRLSMMADASTYLPDNGRINKKDMLRLLDNHLLQLNELDDSYPSLALHYVITGKDEITDKLIQKRDESIEEKRNSSWADSFFNDGWKLICFQKHVTDEIYENLFTTLLPEQIIRLSKIHQHLEVLPNLYENANPQWFYGLIIDALKNTISAVYDVSKRPDWTYKNLMNLLAIESIESPEEKLIDLLLACREKGSYRTFQVTNMYVLNDAEKFIQANNEVIENAFPALSAREQQEFFEIFSSKFPKFLLIIQKVLHCYVPVITKQYEILY